MTPEMECLLASAETVLSRTLGTPAQLGQFHVLVDDDGRHNRIIRAQLKDRPPNAPDSVAIKQTASNDYDPNDRNSWPAHRLLNDWAGMEFLSGLPGADTRQYGPKFYGGDRDNGFIVMEDLGTHETPTLVRGQTRQRDASLVQPLLQETASKAEVSLVKLGRTLGRMHAATVGRVAEYDRIRRHLGPVSPFGRVGQAEFLRDSAEKLQRQVGRLGLALPAQFPDEIEDVASAIEKPGDFLVYTHGDPCPDNCSYFEGHLRLFDFELGDFRHALLDAVYGRIGFPTCWCCHRVPSSVVKAMEVAYRTELAEGCPAAADDSRFEQGVVEACAFWTMYQLRNLQEDLEAERPWGISTARQRVLMRLEIMTDTANEFNHLPALAQSTADLGRKLRQIWPNTEPMPAYPAFNHMEPGISR